MLNSPRRLLVLDDDPTGSQCVSGVSVAFDEDFDLIVNALEEPGSVCFVLTNTRALDPEQARAKNRRIVDGVLARAGQEVRANLHVISRSDSTLRGHVLDEPETIRDVLADYGRSVDGVLFCPAMIEAGRFTDGNVHYALVQGVRTPVSQTDFAHDATFGYVHSDLRDFLSEKSRGRIAPDQILTVSLDHIRRGGVQHVRDIISTARDAQWIVINATEYSDMEVVADAVTLLEQEGRTFITRSGPSMVRPLAGQVAARVIEHSDIPWGDGRQRHGLVVVGSHVGLTTKQLSAVQKRGTLTEFELNVTAVLDPESRRTHIQDLAAAIRAGLADNDCVLYTSRALKRDDSPARSLDIARTVSDAVVDVVRGIRTAKPAWVVAKGGITSHEVAHRGLEISLARVLGQFFPGQISLFEPLHAPTEVRGCPYVVFPGNVGGEQALADVIDRLTTTSNALH